MDAVEYVKQRERMCDYYSDCDKCPAKEVVLCASITKISQMVPIVEQWAKEHPAKTRQSEFLKMWPDVKISDDGIPAIAPCQLNVWFIHGKDQKDCEDRGVCGKCRRDFWLKEIK